jgi:hypothetical protein
MIIQKPKIVAQSTIAFVSQGMINILLVVMHFVWSNYQTTVPLNVNLARLIKKLRAIDYITTHSFVELTTMLQFISCY